MGYYGAKGYRSVKVIDSMLDFVLEPWPALAVAVNCSRSRKFLSLSRIDVSRKVSVIRWTGQVSGEVAAKERRRDPGEEWDRAEPGQDWFRRMDGML